MTSFAQPLSSAYQPAIAACFFSIASLPENRPPRLAIHLFHYSGRWALPFAGHGPTPFLLGSYMKRFFTILSLVLVPGTHLGRAQITSMSLMGSVQSDERQPLPGAAITIIHLPSGVRHAAASDGAGRFVIPNLMVGGPVLISTTTKSPSSRSRVRAAAPAAPMPLATRAAPPVASAPAPMASDAGRHLGPDQGLV